MLEKKWTLVKQVEKTQLEKLAHELNIEKPLANVLIQRGLDSLEKANQFFNPSLEALHDPFLMKDMDKAVARLEKAIKNKEKILIYGDYDVDGTTSVSLVYIYLKRFYSHLAYYIPDRFSEGYGISFQGIDYAKSENFSLVIALDCGIKAVEKIDYANQKGVDFIICDHHTPASQLPDAQAVLDPKRSDCGYPYKELSGCGVGFKLMQAFSQQRQIPFCELYPFLDLLAVSIASDIVPITGENRIFAHFGLKILSSTPRKSLQAIKKVAKMENQPMTISDCVFKIGPRINAAGRIEQGRSAVDLLISEDDTELANLSKKIDDFNETRKNIDRAITQEALEIIASSKQLQQRKTTVLFKANWEKGVVGIVASRLIETHYKPTIILTESNGYVTGSARSVFAFNVYKAIEACADLLENFGGHFYAAGLSLKLENLPAFEKRFEEAVAKTILPEQLIPELKIDVLLNLDEINARFYENLEKMSPFGPENMTPNFVSTYVVDTGASRPIGKAAEHLRLEIRHQNNFEAVVSGVAFGLGDFHSRIKNKQPFHVLYQLEENRFAGKTSLQLFVKDLKIS